MSKPWDAELVADLRRDSRGTEYPDSARTAGYAADEIERLGAEVARLKSERDCYARVAIDGLSGLVPTPEKGYAADGGPMQFRADLKRLRMEFIGLKSIRSAIADRLKMHRDNLAMWENGYLEPTEPDPDERRAVKERLRVAIHELEKVLVQNG